MNNIQKTIKDKKALGFANDIKAIDKKLTGLTLSKNKIENKLLKYLLIKNNIEADSVISTKIMGKETTYVVNSFKLAQYKNITLRKVLFGYCTKVSKSGKLIGEPIKIMLEDVSVIGKYNHSLNKFV